VCRGGRQTDGWLCLYVNLSSAFLVNSYLEEPFLKTLLSFGLLLVLCLKANAVNTTLPEVVVTATRTAQTVDESLASVTVITRDDIDNSQALSVPEILRTVPGLDVSTNGGLGQTTSLFMRGTESDHILVLVDGVKIGSATTSGVPFEHLPLSQVERIEIVRGPRSSLYGSEAIGGVIQIFTRRGKGPLRTEASIGWGDDSTGKIMAGISGSQQDTWYSLYAKQMALMLAREVQVAVVLPLSRMMMAMTIRLSVLSWVIALENRVVWKFMRYRRGAIVNTIHLWIMRQILFKKCWASKRIIL